MKLSLFLSLQFLLIVSPPLATVDFNCILATSLFTVSFQVFLGLHLCLAPLNFERNAFLPSHHHHFLIDDHIFVSLVSHEKGTIFVVDDVASPTGMRPQESDILSLV